MFGYQEASTLDLSRDTLYETALREIFFLDAISTPNINDQNLILDALLFDLGSEWETATCKADWAD